tara:strand:+ start:323 stop:703 length:381 start_codon:yes stop_codon:yes gene_type:complete
MIIPIIIGLIAGIVGGFLGLGGAFVILLLLNLFKIVPDQKTATGTTLFVFVFPLAIIAVIQYIKRNQVNYSIALPIIIFYVIGAVIGSGINPDFTNKQLKLFSVIFLLILLCISLYIYIREDDKKK